MNTRTKLFESMNWFKNGIETTPRMWLLELKYLNPIEKYATNYEWYMSNTEREISDKMCVKPTVGMTKFG